MYKAIRPLKRCLVTAISSKHRTFCWQPSTQVFDQTLVVYPVEGDEFFGLVQSRVHEVWSVLLSATLKADQRYNPSRAFSTFPLPLRASDALGAAGRALHDARTQYMCRGKQGLTKTYNALKDRENNDPRIVELRRLHEAIDRAVLDAYGWTDIEVPPYGTPVTADERRALERFEDEVIDRLFALNAERAEDERRRGIAKSAAASASSAANDTEGDEDAGGADDALSAKAPKSAPRGKAAKGPGLKKTSAPPSKPGKKAAAGGRKRGGR